MAIEPKCGTCGNPLDAPGGLVFSPPDQDTGLVEKYHVCVGCWPFMKSFVSDPPLSADEQHWVDRLLGSAGD